MKKLLTCLVFSILALTGAIVYNVNAPQAQAVYASQDISASIKNRLINGSFKVSQRGTASTYTVFSTNSGYTLADRWKIETAGSVGSTATLSLSTTGLPTNKYGSALKVVATTSEAAVATNELRQITQYIEGYNCADLFDGTSPITISFWHKATKTGTYCVTLNIVGATYFCSRTFTGSTSWTYQTVTFPPAPTGLTINTTTSAGLQVMFPLFSGTDYMTSSVIWQNTTTPANKIVNSGQVNSFDTNNNEYWLFDVQLERGSSPTSFEFRTYAQELALCHRYCYVQTGANGYYMPSSGVRYGTIGFEQWFRLPQPMRATASVTDNVTGLMSSAPTGTNVAIVLGTAAGYMTGSYTDFVTAAYSSETGYMFLSGTSLSGSGGDGGYILLGPSVILIWDSEL
jgi:hypothetical protein